MHCIKLCYLNLFVNTLDIILALKNKYKHQIKNQASVVAVTFTSPLLPSKYDLEIHFVVHSSIKETQL